MVSQYKSWRNILITQILGNMKKILLLIIFFCFTHVADAQKLFIMGYSPAYGGYTMFLGCFNAPPNVDCSIWNDRTIYGSTQWSGIWDKNGLWGNPESPYSPWNIKATNPPLIQDEEGRTVYVLSYNPQKTTPDMSLLCGIIGKNLEIFTQDLAGAYKKIFEESLEKNGK